MGVEKPLHTQSMLSISTAFTDSMSLEDRIPLIAEAGFSHTTLGTKSSVLRVQAQRGIPELRNLLGRHGLRIDTIHGPRADLPDSVEQMSALACAAADLGIPVIVLHPGPFEVEEQQLPELLGTVLRNCSMVEHISRRTGVKFALENVMPGHADSLLQRALSRLNPAHFGFCYDSSHDQIDGPRPFDLLRSLRHRLIAVHLSDRIREFVDHVLPGEGFMDWQDLTAVLRTTCFAGPLLLEVMMKHSRHQDPRAFLRAAYEQARYLHSLVL